MRTVYNTVILISPHGQHRKRTQWRKQVKNVLGKELKSSETRLVEWATTTTTVAAVAAATTETKESEKRIALPYT